jgi:hypothetical protein
MPTTSNIYDIIVVAFELAKIDEGEHDFDLRAISTHPRIRKLIGKRAARKPSGNAKSNPYLIFSKRFRPAAIAAVNARNGGDHTPVEVVTELGRMWTGAKSSQTDEWRDSVVEAERLNKLATANEQGLEPILEVKVESDCVAIVPEGESVVVTEKERKRAEKERKRAEKERKRAEKERAKKSKCA